MKFILLISLFLDVMPINRGGQEKVCSTFHRAIDWNSTKNWKIYKLQNLNQVVHVPTDSLRFLTAAKLTDDSMHAYLSASKLLPAENPIWMGCYLTSFQTTDGRVRKAIISQYAGFLYSEDQKEYFQIPDDLQQSWLNYLSGSYLTIQ